MKLSAFGEKFGGRSGIVNLMQDLGTALRENPDMIFMGGGNPGRLAEVESVFQQRLETVLADPDQRHGLFGIYQSPQGESGFRAEVAEYLKREFGWRLSAENIAVSNGSQPAFFILYNMLAGTMPDGARHSIHLPLSPEYLGYAEIGLGPHFFTATRPSIELLPEHMFKYHVDFNKLSIDENTAALCVSRPTNPTGNVLSDEEIAHLDDIAHDRDIPLIIDGAYGLPFPGIVFRDASPHWNENTILALSLSKLGLPGVRTGILVAREDIIEAYTNTNTIVNLACSTLGPALAATMLRSGEINRLSREVVAPFYRERSQKSAQWLRDSLEGLPCHIHEPEGSIFLWLWCEGLPVTSQVLYERLKANGVLVVPGQDFFVGIEDDWVHKHECIRISYAQDAASVREGMRRIAAEVRSAYEQG